MAFGKVSEINNFGYLGAYDNTVAFCVEYIPRVFVDSVSACSLLLLHEIHEKYQAP